MENNLKTLDLENINNLIQTFSNIRNWDQFHSIKNLAMALSVETSELVEIFQWLTEEQSNQVAQNENLKQKTADELADIFIYLIRILNKTNIDIEVAILNKMQKNEIKYPVEKSFGNSKKYTDF
jgi:NTP pyrophosphatase (non-canonical NTP hydrolase)